MEWFCAIRAAKQKVLQEKHPDWLSDKVCYCMLASQAMSASIVCAHFYIDKGKPVKRFHKMWIHAKNSFRNNKGMSPENACHLRMHGKHTYVYDCAVSKEMVHFRK